jgi:signal transduction histidine kinase
LFAEVVNHSLAGIHVLDHDLRWLAVNHQGEQDCRNVFGTTPRLGDAMPTLLEHHPKDRDQLVSLWQRALRGEAFMLTATLGPQHEPRTYELRFNPIRDDDAKVRCASLIAYDISERIASEQRLQDAEKALRQAHKMEAVGQLTGGIAHDFNNMLGSILAAHEFMEQRLRQHRFDELQGLLSIASSTAQRASAMVQRLLAFARQQALQPRPTDVLALVADIEPLMRGSLGAQHVLRMAFAEPLWQTFIDPPQLENALLNLCLNARDALQAGGTVTLQGANVLLTADQALELDLAVGEYVRVDVSDDGLGMSAEVAARAVDPFFTTKPLGQGTGLGLSMVYGFVRQSQGQLRIHSKPGEGTRIEMYLPRHHDRPAT